MRNAWIVRSFVAWLAFSAADAFAQSEVGSQSQPLATHMKHWIAGSGQWRSPNPDYDSKAEPRTLGWIQEFGVNWRWGPNGHHLVGEIVAIAAGGEAVISGTLYAFYNPVTSKVVQVQVARNGLYSVAEDPVREKPTPYGEAEVSDSLEYAPNGEIKVLRHSNVFLDAETQLSDVYERDEQGGWKKTGQWRWKRLPVVPNR